jgi:hypothetical protein
MNLRRLRWPEARRRAPSAKSSDDIDCPPFPPAIPPDGGFRRVRPLAGQQVIRTLEKVSTWRRTRKTFRLRIEPAGCAICYRALTTAETGEIIVSNNEFEEHARRYASGHLSRRQFVNRLVAGGMTASAALAFLSATGGSTASAAPGGSAALYGTPPGRGGTPPGQQRRSR